MGKLKKLNILRPEIEVEIYCPILGRLCILLYLPKLIKYGRIKLSVYNLKYKRVTVQNIIYLAIPKIKVVDCVE